MTTGSIEFDLGPDLHLYSEVRAGAGEDAEPFYLARPDAEEPFAALAVFDGMGGAGAIEYDVGDGRQSGARIGSDCAREATNRFFAEQEVLLEEGATDDTFTRYAGHVGASLDRRAAALATGMPFKGSMMQALPTTIAGAALTTSDGNDADWVLPFWAGDSRVYALSPVGGLQQLTKDDLTSEGDAFENLVQDSPMSNNARADNPFHINHRRVEVARPYVLLAATDGCFGYVASPGDFESLLLDTMRSGPRNVEEWSRLLGERIVEIAEDDATLVGVTRGFSSFDEMRGLFADRCGRLDTLLMRSEVATLQSGKGAPEAVVAVMETAWKLRYRDGYYGLFDDGDTVSVGSEEAAVEHVVLEAAADYPPEATELAEPSGFGSADDGSIVPVTHATPEASSSELEQLEETLAWWAQTYGRIKKTTRGLPDLSEVADDFPSLRRRIQVALERYWELRESLSAAEWQLLDPEEADARRHRFEIERRQRLEDVHGQLDHADGLVHAQETQ